jgi:hypothetical protein
MPHKTLRESNDKFSKEIKFLNFCISLKMSLTFYNLHPFKRKYIFRGLTLQAYNTAHTLYCIVYWKEF